jgi:hypothetical protein
MTLEKDSEALRYIYERCAEKLNTKNAEYGNDNFEEAGKFLNCTPQQALMGYLTKHLISIKEMCNARDIHAYSEEKWEEKITDSICYLILLMAMVRGVTIA